MTEEELNNQAMLDAMSQVAEIKTGDQVKGEVLAIDDNKQVIVGVLGAGVEGVVPLKELSVLPVEDINELVKVGDVLDLIVITEIGKDKENGSYLLSKRRIDAKKVWEKIEQDFEAGNIIEGTVTNVAKGGLIVDVGVRGFIPASMLENHFVKDLESYKGKTLTLKIIEIEPSENRLILSHKAVVEADREEKVQAFLATINQGDILTGTVARLTNFGAFVNLGPIDGLVHVSEISHAHVTKPADVLNVGDEVDVKVLAVHPENDRISLSIKETLPGPWDAIEEKAPVGSILTGTVKRLTSFGAFVEVFPGVEGLVHISQISHKHIATPHEELKEGEEIQVKVLEVSPENHRLALSIKALQEKPANAVHGNEYETTDTDDYVMPEEQTGFSFGDVIGDQLQSNDDKD